MENINIKKKDKLYYARIIPTCGVFEVCDLTVRTICDTWFSAMDKRDKRTHIFSYKDIGVIVFESRQEALDKVTKAEKNKTIIISGETDYEEY